MSAILGIFSPAGALPPDAIVRQMLGRMSARGSRRSAIERSAGAVLAVSRADWQTNEGMAGPVLIADDGRLCVVADASLYYAGDLRRRLAAAGVQPATSAASDLVLAAVRTWGARCTEHLEGDYAFIAWDRGTREVLCARDFAGKRPLYYAELDGTLVVASGLGGVLASPGCPQELHLAAVAESAAGMMASCHETCYRAVRALPSGHRLTRKGDGPARVDRHWEPPVFTGDDRRSIDAAADELRALLEESVSERLAGAGPTSIWLSGGWDSPAVFGAGQHRIRARGGAGDLRPVSMSYPHGDPGREDELIEAIAGHWGIPVHWREIADVPLFDAPAERAEIRDEPFAHAFEMWNRSLARGSRAVGSHVALEGNGGDQLFQVSYVYLADLLRGGRLLALSREWRRSALAGQGFRPFFRWAVQPLLPRRLLDASAVLRGGRPLVPYLEPAMPPWMEPAFVRGHGLRERERANTPRRGAGGHAAYEARWYLTHPYFSRVFSCVASLALEEGVEVRSPLFDDRIIRFAARRPRAERTDGTETKRLLRRAMRDLLPEHVLATRPRRTGTTGYYFARSLRAALPVLLEGPGREPVLAELGMIDPGALRRAADAYVRGSDHHLGLPLFLTLQTELWLRAHQRRPASAPRWSGSMSLAEVARAT